MLILLLLVTLFVRIRKEVKGKQTRGMKTIPRDDCLYICTNAYVVLYLLHFTAFSVVPRSVHSAEDQKSMSEEVEKSLSSIAHTYIST